MHAKCRLQAFFDAGADVSGVVDQNYLCAVVAYQLSALLADGIRHNDDGAVAFHRAHQRESDPLVAACRLDNDRVLMDQTAFLGVADHIVGSARLDGAAHVQSLKFYKNFRIFRAVHPPEADDGSVPDCFQNV